ncbi:bifunctional diaminohydroxyphosphoribosylaminopyrimidine deaminase/5-amino-6-(5-phosphoribosylamino)uracil reductase RibD [Pseudoalteromonas sp. T1lg76]|uniref:bifunctional diaminohydroxyphosphoribosylaminopyrimidine deaminase/5-amino-6-(5-phosphoribosylamino)uracil reductase RibD n=1 Tax=Pseudoalteromonas sp. T1lg76 TaxID=2077103 RepID=UPI000CF6347A|nr:bifunctional diaminohydroxyphosphoribosylaminopyrimidine deaminase/5-amino-6-(5-phosphoribosylamino)uracil reductase RibD [Pseudoalteromonas sp. T1lg76]
MIFSADDKRYMRRAIELAYLGRFTTTPNPNVGCVLVKDGQIIGEGFHQQAGTAHAEVHALAAAGDKAEGATAYVTLEPCSHTGRTGPCAGALIKAKVAKVICAMQDPNPQVSGRGMKMLAEAGIEVASGLLGDEAEKLNLGFLKRMRTGRPYVTCKLAASLDGKTALANGESKWITGPEARKDVQAFRAQHCAILSGADTVLVDDAKLNVRLDDTQLAEYVLPEVRQPLRVILDSRYRLTPDLVLFQQPGEILLVRSRTASVTRKELDKQSLWPNNVTELMCEGLENGQVNLDALLAELAQRDINSVWLEAGATLAGAMAQQQLIDSYIVYIAPKLMGSDAKGLLTMGPFTAMTQVPTLHFSDMTPVGEDIRLTLEQLRVE